MDWLEVWRLNFEYLIKFYYWNNMEIKIRKGIKKINDKEV